MNFIQKIHSNKSTNTHANEAHSHSVPFWVRHYDRIVGLIMLGKTKRMHQGTIELAQLNLGDAVLDIGCGTGKLIMAVAKVVGHAGTAVGLDVEPAMIAQAKQQAAKQHSHAIFDTATIEQIPYPDNSLDMVISTLVFHHLTEVQKESGFVEIKRVLKPNGRLLIVDLNPSRRGLATRLPGHRQLVHEDHVQNEVTAHLQKTGFIDIASGTHPIKQLSFAKGIKSTYE